MPGRRRRGAATGGAPFVESVCHGTLFENTESCRVSSAASSVERSCTDGRAARLRADGEITSVEHVVDGTELLHGTFRDIILEFVNEVRAGPGHVSVAGDERYDYSSR